MAFCELSLPVPPTTCDSSEVADRLHALQLNGPSPQRARSDDILSEHTGSNYDASNHEVPPLMIDDSWLTPGDVSTLRFLMRDGRIADSAVPMCFHPRGADWGEQYYPDILCDTSGYPVRMCVVGSIAASDIRPVNDTHSEAAVEIELFRLEDIESMIELHTRANPPDAVLPGSLLASSVFHNNAPRLPHVYDARGGMVRQERMPLIHFFRLAPNDIVLVECVLTRVHREHGWNVSFQLETLALLFSAPG